MQGFARHISFAPLLLCVRPPRNSLGAVAPSPCSCNSFAFAMAIYRVNYVDRICDGEVEYGWTCQDFYTRKEALRFARSCEDYEQAKVERLEREDLEVPF